MGKFFSQSPTAVVQGLSLGQNVVASVISRESIVE
jgi:hypothetical protein